MLFQLEAPGKTLAEAEQMAGSHDARTAILGIGGIFHFGDGDPVTVLGGLLEKADWGTADPKRPELDPRAFVILAWAHRLDSEQAGVLLDQYLSARTDLRKHLQEIEHQTNEEAKRNEAIQGSGGMGGGFF